NQQSCNHQSSIKKKIFQSQEHIHFPLPAKVFSPSKKNTHCIVQFHFRSLRPFNDLGIRICASLSPQPIPPKVFLGLLTTLFFSHKTSSPQTHFLAPGLATAHKLQVWLNLLLAFCHWLLACSNHAPSQVFGGEPTAFAPCQRLHFHTS
ncbi:MAG: hypothetical protein AAB316_01770, partial [Bacteroidota bacterium]